MPGEHLPGDPHSPTTPPLGGQSPEVRAQLSCLVWDSVSPLRAGVTVAPTCEDVGFLTTPGGCAGAGLQTWALPAPDPPPSRGPGSPASGGSIPATVTAAAPADRRPHRDTLLSSKPLSLQQPAWARTLASGRNGAWCSAMACYHSNSSIPSREQSCSGATPPPRPPSPSLADSP